MDIYLNFDGDCRTAFEFYRSVFGGDFAAVQTFAEAPGEAGMPEAVADRIMHVSLPMPDGNLMGSDVFEPGSLTQGNNFSISLAPTDRAETDRLFAAISDGGTSLWRSRRLSGAPTSEVAGIVSGSAGCSTANFRRSPVNPGRSRSPWFDR